MKPFVALSLSLTLVACGGGGESSGTSAPASTAFPFQGAYSGTFSNLLQFQSVILETGEIFVLTGAYSGNQFLVNGFATAKMAANGNTIASPQVLDYTKSPPGTATLDGTASSNAISGNIRSGSVLSFSGTPIPVTTYDYNAPAVQSNLTGSWVLSGTDGGTVALTISATGSIAGAGGGCTFSGNIQPRSSGKNVYTLTLAVDSAGTCASKGQSLSGIGIWGTLSTGQKQLILAGYNTAQTLGAAYFGIR